MQKSINNNDFYIIFFFTICQVLSFNASQNAKLEKEVLEELNISGIKNDAKIVKCNTIIRSSDCRTTYRYTVSFNTFTNLEVQPCHKCIVGENVMIKYLATNPAKSRIEGGKRHIVQMGYVLLFLILSWVFILPVLYELKIYILLRLKLLDSL